MIKKNKKHIKSNKVVLLILDGWGLGKKDKSNAIHLAKTPFIDSLYQKYPWTKLCASAKCVGLPPNQVGNSEAGHENIGAGRIVDQAVIEISKEINTGQFFKNPAFVAAIKQVKKQRSNLHIIGMMSNGQSPHSDPDHLLALLTLARNHQIKKIYLHLFTDGRDSPPRSALQSIMALERFLKPNEVIATVIGRFYAMDRKKAWDRTQMAYDAMVRGIGKKSNSPQSAITQSYNADITDEYIEPVILKRQGKVVPRIKDNDAIIFFNLRSDRARQLAKPFVQPNFEAMNPGAVKRKKVLKNIVFVAMTDFGPDLDSILTAYPSEDLKDTLPMALYSKKQVYIAENEKYAHVTYFFNGGYDHSVAGEKWVKIPSPQVKSYAEKPAMSTNQVAKKVVSSLKQYDFICANIACPDMIGHTGDLKAGIKAAEAVDAAVKMIASAAKKNKATLIITADHGNLDHMFNIKTKEIITEHSTNPVPFILVGDQYKKGTRLKSGGDLSNIAPTILFLFGVDIPAGMSRKSLL